MSPTSLFQRILAVACALGAAALVTALGWQFLQFSQFESDSAKLAEQNDPNLLPAVAAVIENHEEARPFQEGLREADVVFEVLVEGEISRFLALYRSDRLPDRIGPIRSLRHDFLDLVAPYRPLLLHIGASEEAYEQLLTAPLHSHDGIRYDGETYERDSDIPRPHNLFMGKQTLQTVLRDYGVASYRFPIFPEGPMPQDGTGALTISVNFKSTLHNVSFTYDPRSRDYLRSIYSAPDQAHPETVAIVEVPIVSIGALGKLRLDTTGQGNLLLFRDGEAYRGSWQRLPGGPFLFLKRDGLLLPVAAGQTWVLLFPDLSRVTWAG